MHAIPHQMGRHGGFSHSRSHHSHRSHSHHHHHTHVHVYHSSSSSKKPTTTTSTTSSSPTYVSTYTRPYEPPEPECETAIVLFFVYAVAFVLFTMSAYLFYDENDVSILLFVASVPFFVIFGIKYAGYAKKAIHSKYPFVYWVLPCLFGRYKAGLRGAEKEPLLKADGVPPAESAEPEAADVPVPPCAAPAPVAPPAPTVDTIPVPSM